MQFLSAPSYLNSVRLVPSSTLFYSEGITSEDLSDFVALYREHCEVCSSVTVFETTHSTNSANIWCSSHTYNMPL